LLHYGIIGADHLGRTLEKHINSTILNKAWQEHVHTIDRKLMVFIRMVTIYISIKRITKNERRNDKACLFSQFKWHLRSNEVEKVIENIK